MSLGVGPAPKRWYATPSHRVESRRVLLSGVPLDYPNIQQVNSFEALSETPFERGVNALCWPRVLAGNFGQVVDALGRSNDGVVKIDDGMLARLALAADGKLAAEAMRTDLQRLRELDLEPELNCITAYPRDPGTVPTDVYSFHVDEAPIETDTWLCTYFGPASEGLRNDQALECLEIEALKIGLWQQFGGSDATAFDTYVKEHSYHLHYRAKPGARPWSFGIGYLWRIATSWPGCRVPPCIHRAPPDVADQPRLLLIS